MRASLPRTRILTPPSARSRALSGSFSWPVPRFRSRPAGPREPGPSRPGVCLNEPPYLCFQVSSSSLGAQALLPVPVGSAGERGGGGRECVRAQDAAVSGLEGPAQARAPCATSSALRKGFTCLRTHRWHRGHRETG